MTPVGMPYDLHAKCCWDGNLLHVELPEAPSAIHVHHPNGSVYFGVPTRVENELRAENAKLRELIEMIGNVCDGTSEVCEYCKNYSATNDECMMLKQMQELGIEV